ncbi:MAG TPA: hypothetical protein VHT27_05325 [Solirubrobacteraceae bacterium]|jgi:hypothetical protein|nr:hypothetical protein [Solirubrobacteraceae bacterium]
MRKHLSYANVVATFALLFAMSGGALAAKHYLLNSVSQINPRVLAGIKANQPVSLRAQVGADGELGSATPGTSTRYIGPGRYELGFRREVSRCAVEVTEAGLPGRGIAGGYRPESAHGAADAAVAAPGNNTGVGTVGSPFRSGNAVLVTTRDEKGVLTNSGFFIVVTC